MEHVADWLAVAILVASLVWLLRRGDVVGRRLAEQRLTAAEVHAADVERQAVQCEAERQSLARFIRELSLVTRGLHDGASDRRIPDVLLELVTRVLEPRQALVAVRRKATLADPDRDRRLIVVAASPVPGPIAPGVEITIGKGELGLVAEVQRVMDRRDFDLQPPSQRALREEGTLPGFRPDLAAPLLAGELTVGVVAVVGPRWCPSEVKDVLRLIAHVTAGAMHQAARYSHIRQIANLDGLTGIANKRHVTQQLSDAVEAARSEGGTLSVLLFDIDNFKHYNDRNGHPAGDRLLKALAGLVQGHIRRDALFGRFGGEEFLLVLPGTSKSQALAAAYNLRRAVAEHPFEFADAQPLGCVSVSGGVATCPDDGTESAALLKSADEALYEAKRAGRNRILPAVARHLSQEALEPMSADGDEWLEPESLEPVAGDR